MPTLQELQENILSMGRNSAKLARTLGDFVGNPMMFLSMAIDRIDGRDETILANNLEAAIVQSGEYNYPEFRERLFAVFTNPEILEYTRSGVDILNPAYRIAGSPGDLQQGIDAARAELGVGTLSRENAALFWKERIYRPAREGLKRPRFFKKNIGFYKGAKRGQRIPYDYAAYGIMRYEETIGARLSAWGDKAPFWIWLNFGNIGEGGEYPAVPPTRFVEQSEVEINLLLQDEIVSLTNEFTNAVNEEIESFLRNPESYQPGSELAKFDFEGAQFRLGVTPESGDISVRRIG